jgi:hypothetical protein
VWPIVICTEPFETLATINAKANNVPDVDIVLIPHPLGSRRPDEIQVLARRIADQVRKLGAIAAEAGARA